MKVALCFSGQPRYLEEGFRHINKNILQKYSPDVFVHTWWDDSMSHKKMELPAALSYGRTYYWKENTLDLIKKLYNPVIFLHEPQITFDTFSDVNYQLARPSNVHSMFFSLQKSNQLKIKYEKENSFLYSILNREENMKNKTGEKNNKPNSVEKIIIANDLIVNVIKSKLKYESKFVYSKKPIGALSL